MKPDLKGMTREEIADLLVGMGEPSYRGGQIAAWLYDRGAVSFEEMTNLPRGLRGRLDGEARIGNLELAAEAATAALDARKYLFRLEDGETIETVLLRLATSRTVCLSSQVGCPVGCPFCATGMIGLRRNLSTGEIVDQFLRVRARLDEGEQPTNVVFMGMGEPLLNFENVLRTVRILTSREGPSMSPRRITISTCGIVPGIRRLVKERCTTELAVSIAAADERKRAELFPLAREHPLKKVVAAARDYARWTRRPVTFEYVLFRGINDSRRDAETLGRLVEGVPCKVNIIRYNTARPFRFEASGPRREEEFREWIRPHCAAVTLRRSKGSEIGAACGQLRAGYAGAEPPARAEREGK
ncbi:MAG: 23S rRNA (adenine(2503)-C(2))-methyltransferase RlmN [bacterium]|nr:23S rRNA (adenine(2503)-C(2))-methyltransferase RlmN [bacterium]